MDQKVETDAQELLEEQIEDFNEADSCQAAINSFNNADGAIPATQPKLDSAVGRK